MTAKRLSEQVRRKDTKLDAAICGSSVRFVDYGVGRDRLESLPSAESQELLSAGAGLLWNPWRPLHVEVYDGHRLEEIGESGDSLQDDGVHFMVTFHLPGAGCRGFFRGPDKISVLLLLSLQASAGTCALC